MFVTVKTEAEAQAFIALAKSHGIEAQIAGRVKGTKK